MVSFLFFCIFLWFWNSEYVARIFHLCSTFNIAAVWLLYLQSFIYFTSPSSFWHNQFTELMLKVTHISIKLWLVRKATRANRGKETDTRRKEDEWNEMKFFLHLQNLIKLLAGCCDDDFDCSAVKRKKVVRGRVNQKHIAINLNSLRSFNSSTCRSNEESFPWMLLFQYLLPIAPCTFQQPKNTQEKRKQRRYIAEWQLKFMHARLSRLFQWIWIFLLLEAISHLNMSWSHPVFFEKLKTK